MTKESVISFGASDSELMEATYFIPQGYHAVIDGNKVIIKKGEEPVSNDLEKAAIEAFKQIVDSDKNSFLEIFKADAQWGKEQTEIQIKAQSIALPHGCPKKELVSKDLEYFAKKESESFAEHEYEIDYIDRNALTKGYYWGVKAGAQWQKEQMMKNSDFINEAEWEDDIHKLFREKGKKVKLMIVKEE